MENFLKTHSIDKFLDFPHLLHAFSPRGFDRGNGVYQELLLGRTADSKVSQQHRQLLLESLNIESKDLFLVHQVHGDRVYILDNPERSSGEVEQIEADALVTDLMEKPIAVLTADCVPVILYDPEKHVAGVIHAGRKGTQMNIVSKVISVFVKTYGSCPESLRLAFGPAIGRCCYEVDDSCIEPFRHTYPDWRSFVTPNAEGGFMLDLLKANESDALNGGLLQENIHYSGECTSCHNDRWFSYRREGTTGRILSLVMLRRLPGKV